MPKARYLLCLVIFFTLLLITRVSVAEQQVYTVGVVPQYEPRRITKIWQPVLSAITSKSGLQLTLKASPSIPEFEKQFTAGEFDFAYMNPYHLIVANEKQGYLPLVRDVGRSLFGIIVVRNDSPISSVEELDGKTVAYPAPNALGAALIPRAEFSNKFHISTKEMYVNSHSSVYLNVALGQADAGGGVLKTLSQQSDQIQKQLRILYKTERVPPHPFTAHPRINKDVQDKIRKAIIELGTTEAGKALLGKIPFKEVGIASMEDYDQLKNMGLDDFYLEK